MQSIHLSIIYIYILYWFNGHQNNDRSSFWWWCLHVAKHICTCKMMKQWTSKVGKVQDIAMRSRVASGGLVSEAQWSTSKQNWYIYKQHRRLIRVAIFTPMVPSNISYNHRGYNPVISWTPWTHHGIQVIEIRRKPGKTMNSWDANSPVRRTVVDGKIPKFSHFG